MLLVVVSSILITLLFFISGFHKIKDFVNVSKGFAGKTNIPLTLAKLIIIGVILLEIIAPLIITLQAYQNNNNNIIYTKLSIISLILFTILATLIYHFPPMGSNYYSFMSNLSTLGGLIMLYIYRM